MLTSLNASGLAAGLLATCVLLLGNVYFGRFEQETPKWRRLSKFTVLTAGSYALGSTAGVMWSAVWLAALAAVGLTVHFVWTRKHGIDPFTAEPYERYRQLRGWR